MVFLPTRPYGEEKTRTSYEEAINHPTNNQQTKPAKFPVIDLKTNHKIYLEVAHFAFSSSIYLRCFGAPIRKFSMTSKNWALLPRTTKIFDIKTAIYFCWKTEGKSANFLSSSFLAHKDKRFAQKARVSQWLLEHNTALWHLLKLCAAFKWNKPIEKLFFKVQVFPDMMVAQLALRIWWYNISQSWKLDLDENLDNLSYFCSCQHYWWVFFLMY